MKYDRLTAKKDLETKMANLKVKITHTQLLATKGADYVVLREMHTQYRGYNRRYNIILRNERRGI